MKIHRSSPALTLGVLVALLLPIAVTLLSGTEGRLELLGRLGMLLAYVIALTTMYAGLNQS